MQMFIKVSGNVWRMGISQALIMTVMNVNLTNS
mgnify:CR=1